VDDLTGGEGEDLFVFADFDRGFDVIRDFVPGTDQIVLDHEGMDGSRRSALHPVHLRGHALGSSSGFWATMAWSTGPWAASS
jgi:Ca2+-binding RTX toxin-like protein